MPNRRRTAQAGRAAKRKHDRQIAVEIMKANLRQRLALLDRMLVKLESCKLLRPEELQ